MSAMPCSTPSGYRVRVLGLGDGSDWLIGNGRHRLGRSEQADLRLAHASVSRLHAEVEVVEGGGVVLTDLDSTNGTWLGERRVTRVAISGDFDIRLGALCLEFLVADAPEPR
ncbi:MAG: FHA domain-containing protein [Rhodanobacteraceae bacterium]|jgi:pSer/pThr/pTyr-binding forkhead associated (FHA) protein|nr:FHA domain-containing protein [Rhodanobacteraceae bacterium]